MTLAVCLLFFLCMILGAACGSLKVYIDSVDQKVERLADMLKQVNEHSMLSLRLHKELREKDEIE